MPGVAAVRKAVPFDLSAKKKGDAGVLLGCVGCWAAVSFALRRAISRFCVSSIAAICCRDMPSVEAPATEEASSESIWLAVDDQALEVAAGAAELRRHGHLD